MSQKYSYSALKQFNNCPRQYHEVKVLRAWPREETEQTIYGTALHLAAEEHVRDGKPLPPEFTFLQPVLDSLIAKPGTKHPELELAVTREKKACDFDSPDVWVRGIADLVILGGDMAWVIDYKTGNAKYPDKDQLTMMALLLFAKYPQLKLVKSALLFVVKNVMVKHETHRTAANRIWQIFEEEIATIEGCHAKQVWTPKQSGLCRKYCPVLTCEFNGRN